VPELRHLRYFVAVAEELNFSRAAERLHMAQPPLSLAIRQLERELGAELFQRSTREVTLTEPGRAFLDGARRTLAEADRAVVSAKRAAAGDVGELRLAFSWSARYETLPALGRAFREASPDVELLTQEMWNAPMSEALRSGQVDLGISLCPEPAPGLASEPVRRERAIAAISPADPLAAAGSVALRDLADHTFLMFPPELGPRLYDAMVDICRSAGFEPKLRNESFHTSWDLRLLGDGSPVAALAPASVAVGAPAGAAILELSEPHAELETRLVWREDESSPMLAAFRRAAAGIF
jgi:LysR family transcriptional regulator, benzoate and cis,cis-muconate-responsive activator of ben and cat genes